MPSSRKEGVAEQHFRTTNEELVQMTRNILVVGPRLGELSRSMGMHRETVRYRFRKHFVERGFVVSANLDYQKLGLRRLIMLARVAPAFEPHMMAILSALGEMSFLTGFAQTLFEGLYIMQVTVPIELREECIRIYESLQRVGIFSDIQILPFEEVRSVPMKPEFYDFSSDTWAYDWQREEITGVTLVPSAKAERERYDYQDLLLLKELNKDARQPIDEIARNLKVPYKMLQYHYRNHVFERGLIKGYKVIWQGTSYNSKTETSKSRRHTYLGVALMVRGTTDGQRVKLIANLNQLPFLWFEASDPDYYAELFLPMDSYADFLKRVRELGVMTGTRPRVFVLDQSKALRFSIGYRLYDSATKKWKLDSREVIARFENLVLNVNSSGGWT